MSDRDFTLRRAPQVDIDDLEEPYEYYFSNEGIDDTDIFQLPGLPKYDSLGFPHAGIQEYLWTHMGENDYNPWYALFMRTDGLYGFYVAECDYTGFGCEDGHQLYIGPLECIIIHAMDDSTYELYISETKPIEITG